MSVVNRKIKTTLRLFPYLKNKELGEKIMIDDDSIHYISIREYAEKITDIIKIHIKTLDIDNNEVMITDMMAGCGGDTISFAKNFKHVYAIEIDKTRCEYLHNNISVYEHTNVTVLNNDCLNIVTQISDHTVVYIDPPWGGPNYKTFDNLRLCISQEPVENICNIVMDQTIMRKIPRLIVLKLPKNYDLAFFYKKITHKNIYYYDLKKMIILVIVV